jgi:hypothetical protein
MDNFGGCPYCGKDILTERYLQREKEIEEWAIKYRSGKLKRIPPNILKQCFKYSSSLWLTIADQYVHPAVAGYFKYQYEKMDLITFLNSLK